MKILFLLSMLFLYSCSKKVQVKKATFDSSGLETKECGVRAADGSGPYISLGRLNARNCESAISNACKKSKFKQVHKNSGHFARGKFGPKIMIGRCR